ncbi:MAG: 2Fe-2S iron-sulfur cluster-binding protein [Clostridiales bacterium]|nr:2Fe-2S iron-sulfur cluster-binding protein [Clostridiales bacterium]
MAITKVKVFRYYPDVDAAPYYQTYEVEMDENLTVLFILKKIYSEMDQTLAFRENLCYKGGCLQCLMTINGAVAKACSTLIKPGEEVLVEPVFKSPVVRDLVVDFGTTVTTSCGEFTLERGTVVTKK